MLTDNMERPWHSFKKRDLRWKMPYSFFTKHLFTMTWWERRMSFLHAVRSGQNNRTHSNLIHSVSFHLCVWDCRAALPPKWACLHCFFFQKRIFKMLNFAYWLHSHFLQARMFLKQGRKPVHVNTSKQQAAWRPATMLCWSPVYIFYSSILIYSSPPDINASSLGTARNRSEFRLHRTLDESRAVPRW